jgi:hypothetical protein
VAEVYATLLPADEEIELHRRTGDWWNGKTDKPVSKTTADKRGTATFSDVEHGDYWIVFGDRAVKVTAKDATPAARKAREPVNRSQQHAQPRRKPAVGQRDTKSAQKAKPARKPAAKKPAAKRKPAAKTSKTTSGRKPARKK